MIYHVQILAGRSLVVRAALAFQHFVLTTLFVGIAKFYSFMYVILMLFLEICQLLRTGLF